MFINPIISFYISDGSDWVVDDSVSWTSAMCLKKTLSHWTMVCLI